MTLDERMEGAKCPQPEVCSLNVGPLIFDYSAAGPRSRVGAGTIMRAHLTRLLAG